MGSIADYFEDLTSRFHYWNDCLVPFRVTEFASAGFNAWLALVFCAINTLLAYGALAEAVKYLPLALISVIISLNPLITLIGMKFLPAMGFADLQPDSVGLIGYWGGIIAVAGVILVVYKTAPR